jgi:hypothetical protein
MIPTRSEFLSATAAAAVAPAVAAGPNAAASPYDFAAIDAALNRPARHRQVFAVARIADGTVMSLVNHTLDAYETTMGEGKGAMHPATVFYSRGVVLGLGDRIWQTYRIAEAARRRGEVLTATTSAGNPFSDDLRGLVARGTTLFVCDNALADWSRYLPAMMGSTGGESSPEEIHAELRRNLVPGALLVPAGVAALNASQEARFTFVQASL